MAWQMIEDIWFLIVAQLDHRNRGRLAQTHPFFRRILKKHPSYQWSNYRKPGDPANVIFYRACIAGFLEVASSLREIVEQAEEGRNINWHRSNLISPFWETFNLGHMSVIDWLWNIYNYKRRVLLFEVLTREKHILPAQWVWQKNQTLPVRSRIRLGEENQFFFACGMNNLTMAQWLYSLNPSKTRLKRSFFNSISHSEVMRWLYSLDPTLVNQESFIHACSTGELSSAQWMYRLKTFDSTVLYQAIRETRRKTYPQVVLWLETLIS